MQSSESTTTTTDRTEFNQTLQRCAEAYHRIRAELPQKVFYHDNLENQQKASLAFLAELPVLIDPKSFQLYIACIAQGVGIGTVDVVDAGRLCHLATTAMSAWKLANLTVPAARQKEKEAAEKREKSPSADHGPRSTEHGPRSTEHNTPLPSKGNHSGADDGQSDPEQPAEDRKQASEDPKNPTPLPSKGNHPDGEVLPYDDWESLYAATKLPDWEEQVALFKSLRERGIELPTDDELRSSPAEALRHCETARYFQKAQQPSAASAPPPPHPRPAKEQPSAQQQQPTQAA